MRDLAVYIDLDGVEADYATGMRKLGFDIDPLHSSTTGTQHPRRHEMDDRIKGTDFYATLGFMPGAMDLWNAVSALDPIINTCAPKFGSTEEDYFLNPYWLGAAYCKRRWSEAAFFGGRIMPDPRFICTIAGHKHKFIGRKPAQHQLLIDDHVRNCEDWCNAGGYAILHTGDMGATIHLLNEFIADPDQALRLQQEETVNA